MNKRRPRLSDDEFKLIQEYRGIVDSSEEMQLNHQDVKHGWLKSDKASLFFKNPNFDIADFDPDSIDWETIFKDVKPIKLTRGEKRTDEGLFDRLVITDVHVGMNPNSDGYSQYGGKWDETELNKRGKKIINTAIDEANANTLIIDDLGDLLDGWGAQTVRRQHPLPQNMDDQKAFDVALAFKINLVSTLAQYYDKVIVNNICNDNHSGAFGYVVNSAFKVAIELMCDNVEVTNHRKFMNHYSIGKNTFIICHGKDMENLKFGFMPHLDKKQMEKIDNYIDANFLLQPGVRIEFSKGDSHQLLLDSCSSDRFDYFNYMALSPASGWIQTNYKKGKSGFTFFNYNDVDDYVTHNKFFKWVI